MPRLPRLIFPQSYYHIITRGNNKNIVFRKNEDYIYFLNLISKYKQELPFNLYHYCLMPNHVHFLIQTKKAKDFSAFMKKLNLSYFYYYKRKYSWTGHFWQDRYKSKPVGKDRYFIQCGKYIELNPVEAGIVKDPKDYPFSSYNYYFKGARNALITESFFYQEIGKSRDEKQKKYRELVISEIVTSSYSKPIWGSKEQRYNEAKKIEYHRRKKLKNYQK